MWKTLGRKRTMNATQALDDAKPVLRGLVQRAERATGSKMAAYDIVARELKASASWIRKALGNQPVAFPAHVYLNMMAAYDAACARMEAEAQAERERFLSLGRNSDAVSQSASRTANIPASKCAPRRRSSSALVAEMVGEVRR